TIDERGAAREQLRAVRNHLAARVVVALLLTGVALAGVLLFLRLPLAQADLILDLHAVVRARRSDAESHQDYAEPHQSESSRIHQATCSTTSAGCTSGRPMLA